MTTELVAPEHTRRNYAKALEELFALKEERRQPLGQFCNGPLQNGCFNINRGVGWQ